MPSTVLKATLTTPSRIVVACQIASGKRPAVRSRDTCARTYGGLGADWSRTISHRGGPPSCVIATVQPVGSWPGAELSNRTTSAEAGQYSRSATLRNPMTPISISSLAHEHEDFLSGRRFPLLTNSSDSGVILPAG